MRMTSLPGCPKLPGMRKPLYAAFIGALIAASATVPGLGNGTLWDNSETAYGEVAREILLTHDWVVMHLNASPWFVQPPLYFWIAALCAKIFGVSSFALRLPSALATMAMGAMTAYALARQAGWRAGVYAGVVLSTCLMQAIVGRLAIMDALLDASVTLAILWWFRAVQTGSGRYAALGWVAVAVGFLAKGPVAPVIALLVIVPYYAWEARSGKARLPSWPACIGGIALFAGIVAPWFGALIARTGLHSVITLIGHYTFGRYTGTIENQSGPVWYYVPVFILGFFPWIAYFPSAVRFGAAALHAAERERPAPNAQLLRLAFVWTALPFLFFSFAKTKLPNYIALEFPAPALLVALYFDDAVRRLRSRSAIVSTAAVPVTILLLAVAIVIFSRDNRLTSDLQGLATYLGAVGAAIFLGSLVTFIVLAMGRRPETAPYVLGVSMIFAVTFIGLALPLTDRFKPIPHLARVIDARIRPGDAIAIQNVAGSNGLLFYTRPPVYVLANPGSPRGRDPRSVLCSSQRTWLVAPAVQRHVQRGYGKRRSLVAAWGKAHLYLYSGGRCTR